MSPIAPHALCYYGLPEHAVIFTPIIELAGGTVIDLHDDWYIENQGWVTIRFSGTEAVVRKVQGIAAIVSGTLDVRPGRPEPEPQLSDAEPIPL